MQPFPELFPENRIYCIFKVCVGFHFIDASAQGRGIRITGGIPADVLSHLPDGGVFAFVRKFHSAVSQNDVPDFSAGGLWQAFAGV